MEQERDEYLMARVGGEQPELLEKLLRRHATPLLTFIERMVGDHHRGEELFQEVFLALWIKRRQYQYPRPFKPWLYAIALNKCRSWFRRVLDRDDAAGRGGRLDAHGSRRLTRGCGHRHGNGRAGQSSHQAVAAPAAGRRRVAHLGGAVVCGNRRGRRLHASRRCVRTCTTHWPPCANIWNHA